MVLGITEVNPTTETAKAAYHRCARLFHPDLGGEQASTEEMARINSAYEIVLAHLDQAGGAL